jgi:hypothetical protein
VVTNDNSAIEGLSVKDKVLAVIFQWFKESGREDMERQALQDMVTEDILTLQTDLVMFIDRCLKPIKQGKRRTVHLEIAGEFGIVLKEVINNPEYKDYYHIKVISWPKSDFKIKYKIILRMEAK